MIVIYNHVGGVLMLIGAGVGAAVYYLWFDGSATASDGYLAGALAGGLIAGAVDGVLRIRSQELYSRDGGGHVMFIPVWVIGVVTAIYAGSSWSTARSTRRTAALEESARARDHQLLADATGRLEVFQRSLDVPPDIAEQPCPDERLQGLAPAQRELVMVDLATLRATLARKRLHTDLWAIWLVNSPLFSLLQPETALDLLSTDTRRRGLADAEFALLGVLALERGHNPSDAHPGELAGWLMVMDATSGDRLCQVHVEATGPSPPAGDRRAAIAAFAASFQRAAQAALRRISTTLTVLSELPPR